MIAEDWHSESWLDDGDSVATYLKAWRTLKESAVFDADAHAVINHVRRSMRTP